MGHYIAGIDPGASGALVLLKDGEYEAYKFPKVGGKMSPDLTVRMVAQVLKEKNVKKVFIEEVHGIKGSASRATFSFGYTCGLLRAAVIISGTPYEMVSPAKWQKGVWTNSDMVYKSTTPKRRDPKATSKNCAIRLYPQSEGEHDGIIDALLIAHYGKSTT